MIPHDQFHLGIWLTSVENPCWYYFSKKKNTNIISNDSFMESVDPPLRKLVKLLHDHGIRTTPSCSGHYKTSSTFQKIYSVLEEDRQKILHQGLLLKDVETGKTHLYQNKHYLLPWSEQDFISQALEYQHRGILGMRLSNKMKLRQKIHEVWNIESILGKKILLPLLLLIRKIKKITLLPGPK
jgi:hypothetical protein